jgi:uncharacterized protein with PIN domain
VAPRLRFFLPPRHRGGEAVVALAGTSTLGHVVEALGVPRTELGEPLRNGQAAALNVKLHDGDVVDVVPRNRPQWSSERFVLDVHLGTLARRMRLLGLDVAYRNDADDDELVVQANAERRVLLTQDRGILRRRALADGAYVAGSRPDDQLADVLDRFAPALRPWTRCPSCNGGLVFVAKHEVEHLLPPGTRRSYEQFSRCSDCARIYWRGAHRHSLASIVSTATGSPAARWTGPTGVAGRRSTP